MNLGDFDPGAMVDFKRTSVGTTGAPTQLAGTPAVSVYKDNSTTQTTTGVTLTVDFDSVTGLNHIRIDLSADGTFYASGSEFDVVITAGTVGGTSVVGYVLGHFSIGKRSHLRPTTAGRTLDVSSGGEAGIDWANIGSPTTAQNLSGTSTKALEPTTAGRTLDVTAGGEAGIDWANIGTPSSTQNLSATTVKTATDVETDTADIQSRIPAALTGGGNMKSDLLAISGDTTAPDTLEEMLDGLAVGAVVTGYTHTTTTAKTNLTSATTDEYVNQGIKWGAGAVNAGLSARITAYDSGTKVVTFSAMPAAPADGDPFIIIGRVVA